MPRAKTAQRHPNLNLTAEEKRVFYHLFQAADTTNLGVITGEIAVPFFEKTHLPSGVLGEVRGENEQLNAPVNKSNIHTLSRYGRSQTKRTGVY